jgi:tRNA threonylcarbamoyladenosine biosynthesis protein TsaE
MINESIEIQSTSVPDTIDIGRAIGAALAGGDVLGLVGQLGAGKTHLAKGIALGLGMADERLVNSPTFVLLNEYAGRVTVHHFDAYRLAGSEQLEALGFAEMCSSEAVVLVEWADRVREVMPTGTLWIEMQITGDSIRRLSLCTSDVALANRLAAAGLDRRG